MAQREEESDGEGALPVAHQLAGGVVDGGDVVGVEGVPQAQGVGRQPDTNAKCLAAQAKPCGLYDVYQRDPADRCSATITASITASRDHSAGDEGAAAAPDWDHATVTTVGSCMHLDATDLQEQVRPGV